MAQHIHVFVADDSPALRRAVRTLLEAVPNIRVVGEAGDYAELLAKVDQAHADIVLMDVHMPGLRDGASLKVQLLQKCVLAMSFSNNPETELVAKGLGAQKLLDKTKLAAILVPAIEECVRQGHASRAN